MDKLKSQDVIDAKRKHRYESEDKITPTASVILTFKSSNLPTGVNIDGVNYTVTRFVSPPIQCYNCWDFGHFMGGCTNQVVCRYCAGNHKSDINCGNEKRCPTCKKNDHHAGTMKCSVFKDRALTISSIRSSGTSFTNALRSTSRNESDRGPSSSYSSGFRPYGHSDLELEMRNLKKQLQSITGEGGKDLAARVKALEEENKSLKTRLDAVADLPERVGTLEVDIEEVRETLKTIPTKKDIEGLLQDNLKEIIKAVTAAPTPAPASKTSSILARVDSLSNLSQSGSTSNSSKKGTSSRNKPEMSSYVSPYSFSKGALVAAAGQSSVRAGEPPRGKPPPNRR